MDNEKCYFCHRKDVELFDFEHKMKVFNICSRCSSNYAISALTNDFDKAGSEMVQAAFINNFWRS